MSDENNDIEKVESVTEEISSIDDNLRAFSALSIVRNLEDTLGTITMAVYGIGAVSIIVGGKAEVLERCRPVLEALGEVRLVGDVGAGETVKIVNNLLLGVFVPATAEALVLGVKAGIHPDTLVEAVENGVGDSHALRKHFKQHVLKGDFSEKGLFSVDYIRKDLDLALELADDLKVPLIFGGLASQLYQFACAKGRSANYRPVIVTLLEELVGVKVRSKG